MDTDELDKLDTPDDALSGEEILDPELEAVLAGARKKARFRLRAEWVMGVIALLAAVLLGFTAVVAFQNYEPEVPGVTLPPKLDEEDPLRYAHEAEPTQETEPEGTEIPTIPPAPNPYDQFDFQYGRHNYLKLQNLPSYAGVDVSAYQGDINWKKVASSGIDFAMIRLGYRGWGAEGKLKEDEFARQNLEGAKAAGLRIGAYFFSQALNEQEVDEEIEFMLEILGDTSLDMPIVLDWEIPWVPEGKRARTDGTVDARALTNMQLHFGRVMEKKGYTPMIYFNWRQSREMLYLSELEEFPFWLAWYSDRMTYPWAVEMWQYTESGRVPGIQGNVDVNVYMP